jgi:hypothetical protein
MPEELAGFAADAEAEGEWMLVIDDRRQGHAGLGKPLRAAKEQKRCTHSLDQQRMEFS